MKNRLRALCGKCIFCILLRQIAQTSVDVAPLVDNNVDNDVDNDVNDALDCDIGDIIKIVPERVTATDGRGEGATK
jgi:hypothetical protein